ncbi:MAG: DUF393 domain-containing protein [Planctomycetes bacterium]|nr:DUF393 domain-containing protein [Planctomycetota bacterium]
MSAGAWPARGPSGGQYSLARAFLGLYLALHFAQLVPWSVELFGARGMVADWSSPFFRLVPNLFAISSAPLFVQSVCVAAVLLALLLALGTWDRLAALALAWIWASALGRNPLLSNPGLPYVGWILCAHALAPGKPYGSLAARGRIDPGADWHYPRLLFLGAWGLLAAGYTLSGLDKLLTSPHWRDGSAMRLVLENPLARPTVLREFLLGLPPELLTCLSYGALAAEILFAPLALFRRTRPWAWLALLAMHLSLLVLLDFMDLTLGMIVIHLFTFDPAWLPAGRPDGQAASAEHEFVFYDGHCGLCHGFVRFVLAEDERGLFRFAPLQGEHIATLLDGARRAALPDSIAVLRSDGTVLTKSAAVAHLLARLGGPWRVCSFVLRALPRPLRDFGYERVAAIRTRLFARPAQACPLLPARLRGRFVA